MRELTAEALGRVLTEPPVDMRPVINDFLVWLYDADYKALVN